MPSQIGYFDTLKSVAGKVFTFLSTITLTGTDGKTVTVTQDTSLDEAIAMSAKAPKASPLFTGHVYGTSDDGDFCGRAPLNYGIHHAGGDVRVTVADNESFTFNTSGSIFCVQNSSGKGAVFFAETLSATIVKLADPSSAYEVTDTDTGGIAVFKGAASATITVKNYTNAIAYIYVNVLGIVWSATAPA
ncbi:MAG: hypothetical protein KKD77_23250 [Gammaproteobacteria bacterium]|nr:hypothetical protein [Gammaproteobacteria bacterium]